MSSGLPRRKRVVAVAGATGTLGTFISKIFLSPSYRPFYSDVRLLVRNPDSAKSQELAHLGATLVRVDLLDEDTLNKSFEGVDVVVNALGAVDHEAKAKLLEGVIKSNVVLYIPSEFGVDHRFNGFDHIMWTNKQLHIDQARSESNGRLKVVAIYTGFFLETAFNPVYGFDKENRRFNIIGSKDVRITYTALEDIARSVVQITTMALDSLSTFPDDVRIAGTTVSWGEIRNLMAKESGKDLEIVTLDESETFRNKTIEREGKTGNPREYLRLLVSEGKVDFSADNQNEMINPGEGLWKWATMEDYVGTIKGHP